MILLLSKKGSYIKVSIKNGGSVKDLGVDDQKNFI